MCERVRAGRGHAHTHHTLSLSPNSPSLSPLLSFPLISKTDKAAAAAVEVADLKAKLAVEQDARVTATSRAEGAEADARNLKDAGARLRADLAKAEALAAASHEEAKACQGLADRLAAAVDAKVAALTTAADGAAGKARAGLADLAAALARAKAEGAAAAAAAEAARGRVAELEARLAEVEAALGAAVVKGKEQADAAAAAGAARLAGLEKDKV